MKINLAKMVDKGEVKKVFTVQGVSSNISAKVECTFNIAKPVPTGMRRIKHDIDLVIHRVVCDSIESR